MNYSFQDKKIMNFINILLVTAKLETFYKTAS